jgi:hypothetical protein
MVKEIHKSLNKRDSLAGKFRIWAQKNLRLLDSTVLSIAVIISWSLTGPKSGMSYETSLINYSNENSFLGGFIFVDPLRPFTSSSYHAANLFSKFFFQSGFLGIQIVFCLLLVVRVLMFYSLIVAIFPANRGLAITSSTIFSVYSADGATLWVGQMNQIACSTAALMSLFYLVKCSRSDKPILKNSSLSLALVFQFYALWSYEAILLPLSLTGIILIYFLSTKKNLKYWLVVLWLSLPVAYGITFLVSTIVNLDSYRASLIDPQLDVYKFFRNVIIELKMGLDPFQWFIALNKIQFQSIVFGLIISMFFALYVYITFNKEEKVFESIKPAAWKIYCLILIITISNLLPFAISTSALGLWRTHLIASISFSLLMGYFFLNQFNFIPTARTFMFIFYALVLLASSITLHERGVKHQSDWRLQQNVASNLLKIAPCPPRNSNLILILPKDVSTGGSLQSPFGDNLWFEQMLKLVYPNKNIQGFYVSNEGVLPPGVAASSINSGPVILVDGTSDEFGALLKMPETLASLSKVEWKIIEKVNTSCKTPQQVKSMYLRFS